ncbi:MAG: aminotransferase class V-fold PLP-dependent enzyme [Clostridia bacterium]
MESIKQDLPKIVYGENDYTSVLFTASGTGGVEAAITSAIPKNGKLLIVENGAYGARQCRIAEYYKISYVSYKLAYGDFPDLNEIEQYLQRDASITHVSIVHHETTTGMLNPVEAICKLAHFYGKEIIVDTVSSFAGIPIDLTKWQAEYIISSSNKCIQGMAGLSFVIFKKSLLIN